MLKRLLCRDRDGEMGQREKDRERGGVWEMGDGNQDSHRMGE